MLALGHEECEEHPGSHHERVCGERVDTYTHGWFTGWSAVCVKLAHCFWAMHLFQFLICMHLTIFPAKYAKDKFEMQRVKTLVVLGMA